MNGKFNLTLIPKELFLFILTFCDISTLERCRLICKLISSYFHLSYFWESISKEQRVQLSGKSVEKSMIDAYLISRLNQISNSVMNEKSKMEDFKKIFSLGPFLFSTWFEVALTMAVTITFFSVLCFYQNQISTFKTLIRIMECFQMLVFYSLGFIFLIFINHIISISIYMAMFGKFHLFVETLMALQSIQILKKQEAKFKSKRDHLDSKPF